MRNSCRHLKPGQWSSVETSGAVNEVYRYLTKYSNYAKFNTPCLVQGVLAKFKFPSIPPGGQQLSSRPIRKFSRCSFQRHGARLRLGRLPADFFAQEARGYHRRGFRTVAFCKGAPTRNVTPIMVHNGLNTYISKFRMNYVFYVPIYL